MASMFVFGGFCVCIGWPQYLYLLAFVFVLVGFIVSLFVFDSFSVCFWWFQGLYFLTSSFIRRVS